MTTDLSDWGSAGNVLGQPQVWIAFIYQSDESNTYVGHLTGANDEDSTTVFTIPTSALSAGNNRVRIDVNQNPGTPSTEWCVELKQAQLIINGGCNGQASCRSVTTNSGIFNPGTVTVTVIIRIWVTTGIISRTITIPGGGMRIINDVIGWIDPGTFGSGSISIVSNGTQIITSRTYNQFAVGAICFPVGTMGQALGGVLTNGGLSAGQTGWIPNLVENNFFRSNIGYTNTGTTTASLTIRLYNGDGVFLGSYNANLAPGQWKQASQPFRDMPGYVWLDAGSAKITVNSGSGVVVYGSVIDNITNEPTTTPFYR